jgi:hypothetical protein
MAAIQDPRVIREINQASGLRPARSATGFTAAAPRRLGGGAPMFAARNAAMDERRRLGMLAGGAENLMQGARAISPPVAGEGLRASEAASQMRNRAIMRHEGSVNDARRLDLESALMDRQAARDEERRILDWANLGLNQRQQEFNERKAVSEQDYERQRDADRLGAEYYKEGNDAVYQAGQLGLGYAGLDMRQQLAQQKLDALASKRPKYGRYIPGSAASVASGLVDDQLYSTDANGKVAYDDKNRPIMSEIGNRFESTVAQYIHDGMSQEEATQRAIMDNGLNVRQDRRAAIMRPAPYGPQPAPAQAISQPANGQSPQPIPGAVGYLRDPATGQIVGYKMADGSERLF